MVIVVAALLMTLLATALMELEDKLNERHN